MQIVDIMTVTYSAGFYKQPGIVKEALAAQKFFFFNDTATTEIYTLSLHDALPISILPIVATVLPLVNVTVEFPGGVTFTRSEEHTSELQSQSNLVCRLLLEKKKT